MIFPIALKEPGRIDDYTYRTPNVFLKKIIKLKINNHLATPACLCAGADRQIFNHLTGLELKSQGQFSNKSTSGP